MRAKQKLATNNKSKPNQTKDNRLAGMEEFKKLQQAKAKAGDCMFC